jgi:hypothetical protein
LANLFDAGHACTKAFHVYCRIQSKLIYFGKLSLAINDTNLPICKMSGNPALAGSATTIFYYSNKLFIYKTPMHGPMVNYFGHKHWCFVNKKFIAAVKNSKISQYFFYDG